MSRLLMGDRWIGLNGYFLVIGGDVTRGVIRKTGLLILFEMMSFVVGVEPLDYPFILIPHVVKVSPLVLNVERVVWPFHL